jgi:hypothetical protein
MPESQLRFRELQKIEVAKDRRRKDFLHHAAASATGIPPLDFTARFDEQGASAGSIGAMPAFPGFHDHGPCTSLRKSGWDVRKGGAMPILNYFSQ